MTREEAKQVIQELLEENAYFGDWTNHKDECQKIADALDLAFNVIDQEPILDKIKAEIDKESTKSFIYPNW